MTATLQAPSENGLIRQSADHGPGTGVALVYGGMSDKLAAIKELGDIYWKANVGGVKTKEQGQCLALVCMAKGIDPFEFAEQYHLVDGKPTLQAHTILKRIRQAGHDVEWIGDLDDATKAEAIFTVRTRKTTVRYTIEEAKRSVSTFAKDGSAWQKTPAAMLRAAVIRKGAKALCPEVLFGEVDPEEFDAPVPPSSGMAGGPTAAEVENRRAQLQQMSNGSSGHGNGSASAAASESVIDVQVESPSSSVATSAVSDSVEKPPFEIPDRPAEQDSATGTGTGTASTGTPSADYSKLTLLLMDIEVVAGKVGLSRDALEAKLKQANPTFEGLEKLDIPGAEKLLAGLQAKVSGAGK